MRLWILVAMIFALSGCASFGRSMRGFLRGDSDTQMATSGGGYNGASFSAQGNVMTGKPRKYKRVTAENFNEGEQLEDTAGSLWKKEGQGSFLFSQNSMRVLGDIINLDIEGKAAENVSTKLKIIKAALARRYAPTRVPAALSAAGKVPKPAGETAAAKPGAEGKEGAPAEGQGTPAATASNQNEKSSDGQSESPDTKLDTVTCRIVEKNRDGSYRVKGQQTIYVGSFEYKLIVTGVIRPDDISSDSIKSNQLIDSKYDLVASNKDSAREPR